MYAHTAIPETTYPAYTLARTHIPLERETHLGQKYTPSILQNHRHYIVRVNANKINFGKGFGKTTQPFPSPPLFIYLRKNVFSNGFVLRFQWYFWRQSYVHVLKIFLTDKNKIKCIGFTGSLYSQTQRATDGLPLSNIARLLVNLYLCVYDQKR